MEMVWRLDLVVGIHCDGFNYVTAQDVDHQCRSQKVVVSDGLSTGNDTTYGECQVSHLNTTTNTTNTATCSTWDYAKGERQSIVSEVCGSLDFSFHYDN